MYTAIVTTLASVEAHPNADRLRVGKTAIGGFQVIVGLDTQPDVVGVFFPEGGQLSDAFCQANNLYRIKQADGTYTGGMFDHKRRVKAMRLRGQISEGLWVPMTYFDYLGPVAVAVGQEFTELNGQPVCQRYETQSTRAAKAQSAKAGNQPNKLRQAREQVFKRHIDTPQLRFMDRQLEDMVSAGATWWVTEKLHGTSGRTGLLDMPVALPWWQRGLNWLLPAGLRKPEQERQLVTGTRNVILGDNADTNGGFYGSHGFRQRMTQVLSPKLTPGMTVYYEIVGWVGPATPIMPPASGEEYTYGCEPGRCELYVYRITSPEIGEWPMGMVMDWCNRNSVQCVPVLASGVGDRQAFAAAVREHVSGRSVVDGKTLREGVVVRVEQPAGVGTATTTMWAKEKSFEFKLAEGMIKNDDKYVDLEEVS